MTPTRAQPARVLHLTDTHLRAAPAARLIGIDTEATLRAVLARAFADPVAADGVDLVIASGDIAHDPEPSAYRRFLQVLRAFHSGALLCVPGNHDLLAPMADAGLVAGLPAELRVGSWGLIGFDSHRDDQVQAGLTTDDLELLRASLDASTASHLLAVCHHPPVAVGCPWLDKDRIAPGAELIELLAGQPRVRGLLFGHLHQVVDVAGVGLRLLGTPSTCFQFAPRSERFTIDTDDESGQPGYRWLLLGNDGALETQVQRVPDFSMSIDLADRS
ncbi:MAG: metallophosphoesterase [Pseudomonadales bacterium]